MKHTIRFKQYVVLTGNFGSGKTEISLNIALREAAMGKKTILVDMDTINPYFRSSGKQDLLEGRGIRVIRPVFANTMVGVPILPGEIYAPFDVPPDIAVFDVGGDPVGAAALGMLQERFRENRGNAEFLFVINGARPMQEDAEQIAALMREIEKSGSFRVTGIVNNTNLSAETDMGLIWEGERLAQSVCEKTSIPPKFIALREDLAPRYAGKWPIFPLRVYMRPEWLDIL